MLIPMAKALFTDQSRSYHIGYLNKLNLFSEIKKCVNIALYHGAYDNNPSIRAKNADCNDNLPYCLKNNSEIFGVTEVDVSEMTFLAYCIRQTINCLQYHCENPKEKKLDLPL